MTSVETADASAAGAARRVLHRRVGDLPRPFWWLWVGTLVNRAGTFIEPFLILYLTGPRHLSVGGAGSVIMVWGIGAVVSQPIGGFLSDRVGRRVTLAFGMFAVAAALGLLALARGIPAIVAASLLVGLVGDIYRPAAGATIADLLQGEQRTRAFALQFWAINLGFSVAAVSAGFLTHLGFGVLFALDAATSLVFGLLVLRNVPETRPASARRSADAEPAWRLLARDRLLLGATALVLAYATLYTQVYVTLPLAVRDAGLGAATYGAVIAVNGIVIVVVQPLVLPLLARLPKGPLLAASMVLVGGGLALYALCSSAWMFGVAVGVLTLGEIGQSGSFQALIAALAPEAAARTLHRSGRIRVGASGMLGPFIGAHLYAVSPGAVWLGCLLVGVLTAAGQVLLVQRLPAQSR